jgi:hypothetical protein
VLLLVVRQIVTRIKTQALCLKKNGNRRRFSPVVSTCSGVVARLSIGTMNKGGIRTLLASLDLSSYSVIFSPLENHGLEKKKRNVAIVVSTFVSFAHHAADHLAHDNDSVSCFVVVVVFAAAGVSVGFLPCCSSSSSSSSSMVVVMIFLHLINEINLLLNERLCNQCCARVVVTTGMLLSLLMAFQGFLQNFLGNIAKDILWLSRQLDQGLL